MLHQIGIGTLGPVFRTYEPSRDRLVAIKVFRLDIVPEQAQALAAALSRAAQASLFHPSIVEPIDAGLEGTLAYRAEEYVAAESLDVAMRHYAPAAIDRVLPFMTQLAGAIDFARAAGIGHGGLHPRDIFVTPDEARATGFGVVEALEQVGIRAPVRRPYSAPERIDGSAWSTPADVFSLAAITFELLTGKRPSGTGAQIGALPDGAHAAALHDVLARAMDDDPSKRYPSALAFAAALEAASQQTADSSRLPAAGSLLPAAGSLLPAGGSQLTADSSLLPAAGSQLADRSLLPAAGSQAATDSSRLPAAGSVLPAGGSQLTADSSKPVHAEVPAGGEAASRERAAARGRGADADSGPAAATPGEFAIEASLDPVHEALDDLAIAERVEPHPVPLFDEVPEERDEPARFTDDFADEQEAEPELRSPLEAPPPSHVEAPMFRSVEPEPEVYEHDERSRSSMLPFALILVVGLLVGFAGGYFVGSRDRLAPAETAQGSAPPAAGTAAPAGAATSETPRPYSEQQVTTAAPPPETRPAPAATPPAETKRTPPPPAAATRGEILVKSLPSRAGVTVNGTWRGRTPLTLQNLAFGTYTVRVVQPGYAVAREDVTLSAQAPSHSFTMRLERAAPAASRPAPAPAAASAPATFTGSLYVDSRPRGAAVIIDGKNVGQTPLSIPELRVGMHVVRIEMDGKKPVTATPRIVSGKTERVTVSLEDK